MGGALDKGLTALDDWFLVIPFLPLAIVLVSLLGERADTWPGGKLGIIIFVIGITGWAGTSRIIRSQVLSVKERTFVERSQALGASRRRILWRHLLPNLVSPIVVAATLGVAHVIVLEAGLSYLGIGVPQTLASWGNIIQDGADQVAALWWMSLFPGLFMVLTVMTLNILGEALRDAYDRR